VNEDRLQLYVNGRETIQKARLIYGNMIGAKREGGRWKFARYYSLCENKHKIFLKEGEEREVCPICKQKVVIYQEEPDEMLVEVFEKIDKEILKLLEAAIAKNITEHAEWQNFFAFVKGVGPTIAAELLSILPPEKFNWNLAKLKSYAGIGVAGFCEKDGYLAYGSQAYKDRKAVTDKPANGNCPYCGSPLRWRAVNRGDPVKYHRQAKALLTYKLATGLMKAKGVYYQLYLKFKEEITKKHPGWNKAKVNMTAVRKMLTVFLTVYLSISYSIRHNVDYKTALIHVLGEKEYSILRTHKDFIDFPLFDNLADSNKKTKKANYTVKKTLERLGLDEEDLNNMFVFYQKQIKQED